MSQPLPTRRTEPPPGEVSYPLVLTGPGRSPMRPVFGIMVGILAFAILTPLVAQLLLAVGWLLRGRPGFDDYRSQALAYELPEGLVASHLGLACLLLVSMALVRYLHGRKPRWLASVQPGMRWRYLLVCLLAAAVVINAVLWASFWFIEQPAFMVAQDGWPYFLVAIVLFAPLQAAAEEFFFRGYVFQALGSAFGSAWAGIVGSALLFAVFHGIQSPALFVDRFGFGLLAAWLVWRTGGLEAAIGAHVVNNLFAFGYGIFTGGVAATKAISEVGWDKAAVDILGFALFALVATWLGRQLNVATTTPNG